MLVKHFMFLFTGHYLWLSDADSYYPAMVGQRKAAVLINQKKKLKKGTEPEIIEDPVGYNNDNLVLHL